MPDKKPFLPAPASLNQQLDVAFALEAAGFGVWELDPATQQVKWDERCQRLFGLANGHELAYQDAMALIHPDDVDRVNAAVQWALDPQSGGQYDVTFRTIGADDGQLRWVRFIGKSYFNPDGQVYRFAGVAQDFTRQIEDQQTLQESEQRFRLLADALPQAVWVTDSVGNVEFLNKWWADYSGVSVNPDTAWQVANDSLHPEDAPQLMAAFQRAIQQGKGFAIEQRNRAASGEYRWFLNVGEPNRDPQTGQITRWVGMSLDIDDRKRAEQALQSSEARFRNIVEQAPMAIGQLKGRDMVIDLGNERLFEVWGKDASVMGKPLLIALPELQGQPFFKLLENVYDTGVPFYGTAVLARLVRQGKLEDVYFDFSYSPIRDADGQSEGILILAVEVTQQVLARKDIEESEKRFRSLVEEAPFAIAVYETSDLRISLANDVMIQLWGKTSAVLGQKLAEALPELEGQPFIPLLNVVYATGKTYRTPEQSANLWIDGQMQTRWYNFVYQPLLDAHGQVYAILNMAVDITEKYLARQQLHESEQNYRELAADLDNRVQVRTQELLLANQDLQRSNENLKQFAYVASHDLQEPLRKIQTFSSVLLESMKDRFSDQETYYLERIQSVGSHMSNLVKDLLTYSLISTRQQEYSLISLDKLLAQVLNALDLTIQERNAHVRVEKLGQVKGDWPQLYQLFQNLLDNALKFVLPHQPPDIQITCQQLERYEVPDAYKRTAHAQRYLRISVADKGIGFDEKYVSRMFLVFQQLNARSQYPGSGIGLAICQRIIENHRGWITATSQPGAGATFHVYLPFEDSDTPII